MSQLSGERTDLKGAGTGCSSIQMKVVLPTIKCRGNTHKTKQRTSVTLHANFQHTICQVTKFQNITGRKDTATEALPHTLLTSWEVMCSDTLWLHRTLHATTSRGHNVPTQNLLAAALCNKFCDYEGGIDTLMSSRS